MTPEAQKKVCDEILEIMQEYDRQNSSGSVDTPGGLEHIVWRLFRRWQKVLAA